MMHSVGEIKCPEPRPKTPAQGFQESEPGLEPSWALETAGASSGSEGSRALSPSRHITKPSNSSYHSCWFMVVKKDGNSLWIVHNLQALNAVTNYNSIFISSTNIVTFSWVVCLLHNFSCSQYLCRLQWMFPFHVLLQSYHFLDSPKPLVLFA